MPFPLGLWDLSLWLAITAAILLVTSQLLSLYHGKTNLHVNERRLKNVALAISILFLVTVVISIIGKILSS